ncbi:MAG: glycerate kinase [Bacteroidetes bacterium]|nr:glycerate kinase [Bacteroidota bacterium]
MNILIAPDSFKGSLSALRAAEIITDVILRMDPAARCLSLPQADGGEGTIDAVYRGHGGRLHLHVVPDPLGRPIQARWLQLPDGSALVESAACIGLPLLREDERNPDLLRSDGLGVLLRHLHERGYMNVYCALGGTATNDAGLGLAEGLGARIRFRHGAARRTVRESLRAVEQIDHTDCEECNTVALADVRNPLCGSHGATATYGPQKGIPEYEIASWDEAISHFASLAARDVHDVDVTAPGMGAAGGLGFALACFTAAELRSGAGFVREHSGFESALPHADLVITGEGRIDTQSRQGKVLSGIVEAADGKGVPVVAFTGSVEPGVEEVLRRDGVTGLFPITPEGMSLADAIRRVEPLLEQAVRRAWPLITKTC